jgi:hypothetical protein
MSKLAGYSEDDKKRITFLMSCLVEGKVSRGEIPKTEEAIKAAMPQALQDAKRVINAAYEFLNG